MSHQAFAGKNNEFYGHAFAGGVANHLASGNYRWKPAAELAPVDFTNEVAYAVAHELGHLWGLGHLIDQSSTPANPVKPDNYHDIMNTPRYSNPATARFRNNSTHLMEIGDSASQSSSYIHVNAHQEVLNSLRTTSQGNFLQATVPNAVDSFIPTYRDFYGEGADVGDENPPPVPRTTVPAATIGTADGITIEDIAGTLTTGFETLRSDYLDDFASQLNLPSGALPLLRTDLGTLLGLGSKLSNAISSFDVSNSSTMSLPAHRVNKFGVHNQHRADRRSIWSIKSCPAGRLLAR